MARRLVRPGTDFPVRRQETKKKDPRVRERAEKLAESGMPFQMAMAVAYGKLDLNEALERMARTDKIEALMKRYDLSRALGTQIILGQASLERVLYRRRFDEHRQENRDRSFLEEVSTSGQKIVLGVHGKEEVAGIVTAVTQYTLDFLVDGEDESEEIHKLQLKYAFTPEVTDKVHAAMRLDDELRDDPETPIERPQDRYACSDKRLFHYLDGPLEVEGTLLEGEVFTGTVSCFSRFEFTLKVGDEAVMIVFRHALFHLQET